MLSVVNPLDWATVFRLMLNAELKVLGETAAAELFLFL